MDFIKISKGFAALDTIREPLGKLIPNLAVLREDPVRVLQESPIQIKVCPPYGACTFFALFIGFFLIYPAGAYLKVNGSLVCLAWLSFPLLGLLFAHSLNRGNIILHSEGIEFRDRHSRVTCPWCLFCVDNPQGHFTETEIFLPIQMAALPLIEFECAGLKTKIGKSAQNNHFRISSCQTSQTYLILKDRYLAKGNKLGELIMELAQR